MPRPTRQWEQRIGRRLRLRDLHIFFAVVQHGSMAKAASELGMAQPSVSEAIASLEDAVGVKLLDRSRRGVEATMFGLALLKRGRAAFDELGQAVRDIEFLADPTAGEIRIACPEALSAGLLPAIIAAMSRKHPHIVFRLVDDTIAADFRELRARNVDLALVRLVKPLQDDELEAETLFEDHTHVVAGATHPLARRRKIELSELLHERWIAIPSDGLPDSFLSEAFRKAGLEIPSPAVVTYSQHVRYHLLTSGPYVTSLPDSALRFNAAHFALKRLPVALQVNPRPVAIVTVRNRMLSPIARIFVEHARETARAFASSRAGARAVS
jgi:DNA-binding transcriptional LysR family regulator